MAGYIAEDDFRRDILQFTRGMKRKVTEEKMHLGDSLEEGKKASRNGNGRSSICSPIFDSGMEFDGTK